MKIDAAHDYFPKIEYGSLVKKVSHASIRSIEIFSAAGNYCHLYFVLADVKRSCHSF